MGRAKGNRSAVVSLTPKEPGGSGISFVKESYQSDLGRALTWYGSNATDKQRKKWMLDYAAAKMRLPAKDMARLSSVADNKLPFGTMPVLMRLVCTGAILSKDHQKKISFEMDQFLASISEPKPVVSTAVVGPSIQDRLQEKIAEFLGEFEGALDDYVEGKDNPLEDAAALVATFKAKQVPAPYAKALSDWCDSKVREFGEALTSKDDQIREGYSNYTKGGLIRLIKSLSAVKGASVEYAAFKKVNRAPRKRKEKPAAVQVAKLKYKVLDDALKITSVDPSEIIGADQVWTFNTKTRTLAVYRASGPAGLRVKGTTVIGFEPEASQQKRLRKPEDVLKKLADAGKVVLRKFMDGIKAVEYRPNGRVNKDVLLVRIL